MAFIEQYSKISGLIQEDIDKVSENVLKEINLLEPLNTSLRKILTSPSKHIRAAAAFLYLKANNQEITPRQIELQSAVELIHNASLIHDDIIDESDTRRNTPTINSEFDSKLAVISGDYLLAAALKKISRLDSFDLLGIFSTAFAQMCTGEISQYFSKYKKVSLDDYIAKSQQKTASLFQSAIEGAAIVSGNINRKAAADFAINFGIAFQIRDDLINFETTRTDINDGIYTAPVILSDNEDFTNGIEKTRLLLNNYIDKSADIIKNLEKSRYKTALIELLELFRHE